MTRGHSLSIFHFPFYILRSSPPPQRLRRFDLGAYTEGTCDGPRKNGFSGHTVALDALQMLGLFDRSID